MFFWKTHGLQEATRRNAMKQWKGLRCIFKKCCCSSLAPFSPCFLAYLSDFLPFVISDAVCGIVWRRENNKNNMWRDVNPGFFLGCLSTKNHCSFISLHSFQYKNKFVKGKGAFRRVTSCFSSHKLVINFPERAKWLW